MKKDVQYKGYNPHPGTVLTRDFLERYNISQSVLSRATRISVANINGICNGKRAITASTALRLAAYFGNHPRFWMELQMQYDLMQAYVTVKHMLPTITNYRETRRIHLSDVLRGGK
jgi:addiction module HigA family antidote